MDLDIEQITSEWTKDAEINEINLEQAAREVPRLHAKYLTLLSKAKLRLVRMASDYDKMRQLRYRWYRGELDKPELDQLKWPQYQGIKPIVAAMNELLKGDPVLKDIEHRIEYMTVIVSTLESIMKSISQRSWDVGNTLKAKIFYSGN